MTNAIELSHIQKTFPQFALRDVNLAVPTGTICGLVGENGAGKSTLIRILMGALRPESGRATVLGADTAAPDFPAVREDIGVVLDEGVLSGDPDRAAGGAHYGRHLPPLGAGHL